MNASEKKFLFDLLNTPSPSGFEIEGQRQWAAYVRNVADRVENDHYGNTWATIVARRKDNALNLLLEAHADEVGFMINYISDEGYLYVTRIGGADRAIVRGRSVRILGDLGEVTGVFGNTAIHLRNSVNEKIPKWEELFVDIGAQNKEEVLGRGLRVGHPMVLAEAPMMLGKNRLVGRALDNRVGGYILARVMANLKSRKKKTEAAIIALNAVQEEIGGNGARMAAYRLKPDVAVVLDVTHATDSPGIAKPKFGDVKMGGGPSITHGTANHPLVVRRLMDVAEKEGIAIQHEASSRVTGTDTDDIFVSRSGVPSALVSLPMRYMHSTVEMVDMADVEAVVKLLTAFAVSVKADDVFSAEIG